MSTKKKTTSVMSPPPAIQATPDPTPESASQMQKSQKKLKFAEAHAASKQRQAYSQTVYTSRFAQFRVLRVISWSIGIFILVILCFGLWRLYRTVFDTIEQTQNLFFTQQTKRTDIINFSTLEEVRDAWQTKYNIISTSTPREIFGEVTPVILDTAGTEVKE
ncbi:MAG: hypothetical protein CO029_02745 [Candidatus Magasanikbacteria bacterium CG_4_9_14_0_2_um_filter_41_10]|uniref:Uncharacterized protein n=1 Tax=Candidatus Magasanikbacteria bacterium CG_4_10_14_0_2_um_filter_41_31 TaxID=1974639 RepID=A0A2M7V2X5_9BACT|nr:MAG: hypothetical protein AUJ37_03750 [Candidatus Magasanikbacteria bacterium CG1_02_41_34]PIZ92813.1 MAG: hypothetical protein COX83_03435 [Candidatus Magasanikbacteria bacterium CG_4_10_14_0_2_um_filter_41_31]PJC53451.1 MAG: hypothetical protein CO029_02745 [Candidatus Magasanikbacteria bacterium CG_4_9_14_0_2_um_filter_41_10]